MATSPIKKDIRIIGINLPKAMVDELEARADSVPVSLSNYCKIVIQQWIDSGETLNLGEK